MFNDIGQLDRYFDMLINQSYSNEEKAGSGADSVADKLSMIKDEILRAVKLRISIEKNINDFENQNIRLGDASYDIANQTMKNLYKQSLETDIK